MTFEKLYVLSILIIYLAAFFVRNLKTYFSSNQSIRGKSLKLTISLALSSVIYLLIFGILFYPSLEKILIQIGFMNDQIFDFLGMGLLTVALIIGLAALYEMKNSWRVGIKYDQKTELITGGIYSISRNPYFLSYDMLFMGIFFLYPNLILLVLVPALAIVFHLMILEEERYLIQVHGEAYNNYRNKTGRYFFGI